MYQKCNFVWGLGRVRNKNVSSNNLGQNIADNYTKLSDAGFSIECFTADFLQLCSTSVKI